MASGASAETGQLALQALESLQQVDDDRGAIEAHVEVDVQANHPPEPRRGRRRELTGPGRRRLHQSKADQAHEPGTADAGGPGEFLA